MHVPEGGPSRAARAQSEAAAAAVAVVADQGSHKAWRRKVQGPHLLAHCVVLLLGDTEPSWELVAVQEVVICAHQGH